jgi:hypothetical protein
LSVYDYSYTRQRVPYGMLVTNWSCSGCLQANHALTEYLADQDDAVAVMRVHCWWPNPIDPMYLANVEQNTWLIEDTPLGPDYAPHLWVDGNIDAGYNGAGFAGFFEDRKLVGSPLEIAIDFDEGGSRLHVVVHLLEPLPPDGDYVLRTAVTEDDIFANGGNGETIHDQVFRYMYPDVDGLPVPNVIGDHEYWVETPLDTSWVFENLRGTAYVRDRNTKMVLNAATAFLQGSAAGSGDGTEVEFATGLRGAHPNPFFSGRTVITFTLNETQAIELSVLDPSGRLVSTLASGVHGAGEHVVYWDGRSGATGQRAASGVYLLRLETETAAASRRLVLLK